MRILRNLVMGGIAIGASLALVAPAEAGVYYTNSVSSAFSFSFGGSSPNNFAAGNSMSFSSTVASKTLTVSATAWNATKGSTTYSIKTAELERWSGGLGVTSTVGDDPAKSNCDLGQCNSHEIDNLGNNANTSSIDFVRLDFNDFVVLGGITQTVYPSLNPGQTAYAYDADFSIGRGIYTDDTRTALTATTNVVNNMAVTNLTTYLFTKNQSVTSCTAANNAPCTQSQTIYSQSQALVQPASKTWYVAASVLGSYGLDNKTDGFKLANLSAYVVTRTPHQSAVPEPSSWMTMIAGFGVAGVALRRSRRQKAALTA